MNKNDTLYEKIKKVLDEGGNYQDIRDVALAAYERKNFDIAEIFSEKGLSLNSTDKELLCISAEVALRKKNYHSALGFLKDCKKYHKLDVGLIHDYFKCMEQCEQPIGDEDVELIKQLFVEDSLFAPERYLLLNYNRDKNDTGLWEMYFESKENAGKSDDRKAYKNACVYSDERWKVCLTFREEYSVIHRAWLSRVVVKSLLDNESNEVMVAENSDATTLVGKLKIKNVKDALYKTDKGSVVCLEQKVRVKELKAEGEEANALS